jgi:hypothetical protein
MKIKLAIARTHGKTKPFLKRPFPELVAIK